MVRKVLSQEWTQLEIETDKYEQIYGDNKMDGRNERSDVGRHVNKNEERKTKGTERKE